MSIFIVRFSCPTLERNPLQKEIRSANSLEIFKDVYWQCGFHLKVF